MLYEKTYLVRTIILAGSLLLQLSPLCFRSRGSARDVDLSFDSGSGVNGTVSAVAVQPDGKVIIGGGFTTVRGLARIGVARLNAHGSGDSSFNAGAYGVPYGAASALMLQPDGKFLIGGGFISANGANYSRGIARLNANGSLDTSFKPGTGANGSVLAIALQSDGNVLIGGDFTTVNGVLRPHIARLYHDSVAPSLNIARSNAFVIVSWPAPPTGFELQQNTNLNPATWTMPSETVTDNGTTRSITVSPVPGSRFFRLFKP